MYPVKYIQAFFTSCAGAVLYLRSYHGATTNGAVFTTAALATSWLFGLYTSLLVYRILFHPLKKFPGPPRARIGSLWLTSRVLKLNAYYVIDELHKKYGSYVRIGPNMLSVIDPQIMTPAFGPGTKVIKGPWYDGSRPHDSMHTTRDKAWHDRRRRVWAPAFSDKALREYEPLIHDK
ncbi:hypothetical protein BST61_g7564 [Cercospora zeina]